MAKPENKKRDAKTAHNKPSGGIKIISDKPKTVPYPNPPGMTYVDAEVTYENGETVRGIYLLSNDQIERING